MKRKLEWILAVLPGVPTLAGTYIALTGGRVDLQIVGAGIAVWQGIALGKNVINLLKAKVEQESS